jgi:copper ion binding protein
VSADGLLPSGLDTPTPYWKDALMTSISQSDETREYTVAGMTCSHCVNAVREAVGELEGVRAVEVDLRSAHLRIAGSALQDDAVRGAVADAGYRVV